MNDKLGVGDYAGTWAKLTKVGTKKYRCPWCEAMMSSNSTMARHAMVEHGFRISKDDGRLEKHIPIPFVIDEDGLPVPLRCVEAISAEEAADEEVNYSRLRGTPRREGKLVIISLR